MVDETLRSWGAESVRWGNGQRTQKLLDCASVYLTSRVLQSRRVFGAAPAAQGVSLLDDRIEACVGLNLAPRGEIGRDVYTGQTWLGLGL